MTQQRSQTLVCIPCFNSEGTIADVVRPILDHSDADILLIDDTSDQPLQEFIAAEFPGDLNRITVLRPNEKLYTGGSKNIGIRKALREGYRTTVLMDSDVVCHREFFQSVTAYFRANPTEVIVAPAILPYGTGCQYADTVINFSTYLPDPRTEVSRKHCLAGYAFALNMDVFRNNPCFMPKRIGGDDVLFFRYMEENFQVEDFPILNRVAAVHKPPRCSLKKAFTAQLRYARAFFSHNDLPRAYLFNKIPLLHLLTPRFFLMLIRIIVRRRYRDVAYLPLCWCLDFTRGVHIARLGITGFRDPANNFSEQSAAPPPKTHIVPA